MQSQENKSTPIGFNAATEKTSSKSGFSVYDYFDYRRCLDDFYHYRKSMNRRFSYRSFALKAAYKSSGLFIQLVKNKLNMTRKMLPGFIQAMGLDVTQAEYFDYMVHFTHARNAEARQHWFNRMVPMLPPKAMAVALEQKKYYEKWFHVAIRESLSILNVSHNYEDVARFLKPPVTVNQARASMTLLAELGLIRKDAQGYWRATDAMIKSTPDLGPFLIHAYQESLIDLGKAALQRFPRDRRNIACFTFSLSHEGQERLSLKVNSFFKEVADLVRSDQGLDRVCQLNIQMFPLSEEKST